MLHGLGYKIKISQYLKNMWKTWWGLLIFIKFLHQFWEFFFEARFIR